MSKKLLLFLILIAGIIVWAGYSQKTPNQSVDSNSTTANTKNASGPISRAEMPADKIEVVHFHAAQQCWSCIAVGEYALKTIKEKFPEEYENGIIVFKDINGELSKNKDIVMKYQARGSSLFVNAVTDGKNKIEEDVAVWRLIGNQSQFINYFEDKLNKLLGK